MMAASSLSLSGALQQVGNHLWQSTLCLVVVALLTLVLRNNRAHVRHWLWLAASVKFLVPFAPLTAIGGQFGRHSLASTQLQTSSLVGTLSQPFSQAAFQFAATTSSDSGIHSLWAAAPALLVGIWFLGCAAVLLTWGAGWRRVSRAVRQGFRIQGVACVELKLLMSVTAFADEVEREKVRQRVMDALSRKARLGYVVGGRVFGYDNVPIYDASGRR